MELQDKEVFKQKESDQTDLCISSDSSKHGKEEGNVPIEVEIGAKQEDAETGFERNHSVRPASIRSIDSARIGPGFLPR
jgi:hypothetical protein